MTIYLVFLYFYEASEKDKVKREWDEIRFRVLMLTDELHHLSEAHHRLETRCDDRRARALFLEAKAEAQADAINKNGNE